jgi:hypothetical protein
MCYSQLDIIYPVCIGVCLLCGSATPPFFATNSAYHFEDIKQGKYYGNPLSFDKVGVDKTGATFSVAPQSESIQSPTQAEAVQQVTILTEFASKLLSEMKDLDPDFSKTVDENFWDLIYDEA